MLPDHEVAIVGSGFAGLGMAIELARAGSRTDSRRRPLTMRTNTRQKGALRTCA